MILIFLKKGSQFDVSAGNTIYSNSYKILLDLDFCLVFTIWYWYFKELIHLLKRKKIFFLRVPTTQSHNMKSRNLSKKPATLRKNRDQCLDAIQWSDATLLPWKIIQLIGQKSYHFFLQNYAFGKCQQLKKEGRSTATT